MRLHSYVLDHDYGFAPNPFHGVCTLATCKPRIRAHAAIGDIIVGSGCAKRKRTGYLVYFMLVDEILTFDEYWADPRFFLKRPNLKASKALAFGDNIYHRTSGGKWDQENSFHSLRNGKPNPINVDHDTKSTKVLVGHDFAYWGGSGPVVPDYLRDFNGEDLCVGRGHKNRFEPAMIARVVDWIVSLEAYGVLGRPLDWPKSE